MQLAAARTEDNARAVRLANRAIAQAQEKYGAMWTMVTAEVRRDLALAQLASWAFGQDDQALPISRVSAAVESVLSIIEG